MKKLFLSAILLTVLCIGLALLPISAAETVGASALPVPTIPTDNWIDFTEAVSEKDSVYEISTSEQLAWVAKQTVIMKNDFSGKTLKLMNDIDLSAHLWTPIGNGDMPFAGNFDGQDHTVKGLVITDASNVEPYVSTFGKTYEDIGLFGYTTDGTLKNTVINNAYILVTNTSDYFCVGSLVGKTYSLIENCHITSSSIMNTGNDGWAHTGGLAGKSDSSITNCTANNITTTGTAYTGGLVGYVYSLPYNSSHPIAIINCSVSNATVTGGSDVGGLAARSSWTDNCSVIETAVTGGLYTGGLIGYASQLLTNCNVSHTTVTGGFHTGGLAGHALVADMVECHIRNATVTSNSITGGLVGYAVNDHYDSTSSSISRCTVQATTVSGSSYVGGLIGRLTEATSSSFSVVLSDCHVSETDVTGSGNSDLRIGGLVGTADPTSSAISSNPISNCTVSNTTVTGKSVNNLTIGGFAGECRYAVLNCGVSMVDLIAKSEAEKTYVGGFCGQQWGGDLILNCYAVVSLVSENTNLFVGGFVGSSNYLSIANCYVRMDTAHTWYGITDKALSVKKCYYNNTATDGVEEYIGYNFDGNAMTDAEMKSDSFVFTLNNRYYNTLKPTEPRYKFWVKDTQNVNGGYPMLSVPTVESLSYQNPLPPSGGAVEIAVSCQNLAGYQDTVLLTASSGETTIRPKTMTSSGNTVRATLDFPKNETASDIVYTLSFNMGNVKQILSKEYTLTVKSSRSLDFNSDDHSDIQDALLLIQQITADNTDNENHSFDLNYDGYIDVLDVIFLIKYIFGNAA